MNNGDAARNLREHIFIASVVFFGALFLDHGVNLLNAINIHLVRNEVAHPYQIGEIQVVLMAVSMIHLLRKLNEYRYYANLLPDFLKKEL